MKDSFVPKPWMRNPHLQTILGSIKIRFNPQYQVFRDSSRPMIVNGGDGVRLLGYYSPHPPEQSRGLITLLHGWEGSSDSTYIIRTGFFFHIRGYSVFRLNLRDHGNSHHLNPGLFHGARTEEVYNAVSTISHLSGDTPYYIIGFSLGGNFALRIALVHSERKIENLHHVISISPPLDPYKATLAVDRSFCLYRYYFLRKWKNSLKIKQRIFPDCYHFNSLLRKQTCLSLTEALMHYFPDFTDYRDYFMQYTLLNDTFRHLTIPVTVITSKDDPIVSVQDFYTLYGNEKLKMCIESYGGHCGFIDFPPFECWYLEKILTILTTPITYKT